MQSVVITAVRVHVTWQSVVSRVPASATIILVRQHEFASSIPTPLTMVRVKQQGAVNRIPISAIMVYVRSVLCNRIIKLSFST